jgi:hypothetical protein
MADSRNLELFLVACYGCGWQRETSVSQTGYLARPECPLCGDLGWHEVTPPARWQLAPQLHAA